MRTREFLQVAGDVVEPDVGQSVCQSCWGLGGSGQARGLLTLVVGIGQGMVGEGGVSCSLGRWRDQESAFHILTNWHVFSGQQKGLKA